MTREPPPRQQESLVTRWGMPAVILAVAAWVRFNAIGRSSFWSDEGNTWALVQRSWFEIATAAAADIHPPGYYWLLKVWSLVFGNSEVALRSFSALCGLLLVWVILALGRRVVELVPSATSRWMPLNAAWLAALLPFMVFYSQEARMYMLLALLASLLFLILLHLPPFQTPTRRGVWLYAAWTAVAAAGLWTHYLFPLSLATAGLVWFLAWARRRPGDWPNLAAFAAVNLLALLTFAPWLGNAWRQLTTWPQGGDAVSLAEGGRLVVATLLFGLIRTTPEPEWPWFLATGLLPVAGAVALRRHRAMPALLLWLGTPIAFMAGLGLFTQAFLKFLLVAAAPWCLLVGAAPESLPNRARPAARALLAAGTAALALLTLPAYYGDPAARDNYRGVALWLAQTADPERDVVLLNAPGQADVWRLYNPGLPVLALPSKRPPDHASIEAELAAGTTGRRAVHALLWATDESDPLGYVESWLERHFFRGVESWQGNVRFVSFFAAPSLACRTIEPGPASVALEEVCLPDESNAVVPGATLPVQLGWRVLQRSETPVAASLQLLDARNQVVAQIDEPLPSATGEPEGLLFDQRALPIAFGVPPGRYRLIVAAYDPATGIRLPLSPQQDVLDLGSLVISRAAHQPPPDVLPIDVRTPTLMGHVRLLGYTQFKAGFAHNPETALAPGDRLHVTLFWQAPDPLPGDWPAEETFTLHLGDEAVTLPLAGGAWPTGEWQAGDIVRAEVEIAVTETNLRSRPTLTVGATTITLDRLPR